MIIENISLEVKGDISKKTGNAYRYVECTSAVHPHVAAAIGRIFLDNAKLALLEAHNQLVEVERQGTGKGGDKK